MDVGNGGTQLSVMEVVHVANQESDFVRCWVSEAKALWKICLSRLTRRPSDVSLCLKLTTKSFSQGGQIGQVLCFLFTDGHLVIYEVIIIDKTVLLLDFRLYKNIKTIPWSWHISTHEVSTMEMGPG